MWNINKIKLVIYNIILLGVFIYQGSGWLIEFLNYDPDNIILTIPRILSTILTIFFTLKFTPIVKLTLGSSYIAGRYEGKSTNHSEIIHLSQSLLQTTLTGNSFNSNKELVCTYKGTLYHGENGVFEFITEMTSVDSKQKEWGLLTISLTSEFDRKLLNYNTWFKKNIIQLNGIYNSLDHAEHNKETSILRATKV